MYPKARDIRERIKNGTASKEKASAQLRKTAPNHKKTTVWENIVANDTSDKGLLSKNG